MRSRSSKLLLFLFTALVAVGVFVYAGFDEAEDWADIAYEESTSAADLVPPEAVADPFARAEIAGDALARDRLDPAPSDRTARGPARAATVVEAELGFRVRAVVKTTGAAVEGASVLYFDTLAPGYRQFRRARRQYRADKEAALRKYGERAVTDSTGVAILPHGIPHQWVAVRYQNLYAEVDVSGKKPPPDGGYVAELDVDRTLLVQVVDKEERPVTGVHLCFYVAYRDRGGKTRWALWRDPHRDTSSPDGIQRMPHVQRVVGILRELAKADPIVHIGIDAPGMTRCGPSVDAEHLPEETMRVVVPDGGSVAARVTDTDGFPVQRRVRLSTAPDFPYPDLAADPGALVKHRPSWVLRTDAAGRVRFPRVAVGTAVRVESLGRDVTEGEVAELAGPGTAGQEVSIELQKSFTAAWLEGLALDGKGRELRSTALTFAAKRTRGAGDTQYLCSGSVRTDERGRYRIRLAPTEVVRDKKNREVEINVYSGLRLAVAGAGSLRAGANVRIPARLHANRYDLGTVQLALPPLIASGRVFLDDKPYEGFDRFVLDFRNPDNKNRWQRIKDLAVHARPGGRFEVRGDLAGRHARLRPRQWGCLPVAPLMLDPGQRDLEFRLYKAGTMRLAVLYDIEAADAAMEVMLVPVHVDYPEVTNSLKWQFVGRVDKRGSGNRSFRRVYWWTGLPPGTYRIELRLLGGARPFRALDELHPTFRVPLDQVDPEVINLRGAIRRVTIKARDAKGRPLAGMAFPLDQTALGTNEGVKITRRGAVLHTADRHGVDVQVVARGYRPETVYGAAGEQIVTLRPGIPITVRIASPPLPKGVRLRASLRRRTYDFKRLYRAALRNPVNSRSGSRPLTILMGERTVTLRYRGRRQWKSTVMEHGTFTLYLELATKGHKPVRLTGYSPSRLVVRDAAVEHKFGVNVNRRRFEAALRKLGVEPVPRRKKRPRKQPKKSGGKKR